MKNYTKIFLAIGIIFLAIVCLGIGGLISFMSIKKETKTVTQEVNVIVEEETEAEEEITSEPSPEPVAEVLPELPAEFVVLDSAIYTYDQMVQDLQEMQTFFSDIISLNELGITEDGRSIPEVVIGNQQSDRHIIVQASIHGREYMNTILAMRQLEYILRNYDAAQYEDQSYRDIFNQVCVHLVPMTNPDGVTISQFGIDGIRSQELRNTLEQCYQNDLQAGRVQYDRDYYWKRWKSNARGVDLNRNFNSGWEQYVGSGFISADHYKGEYPESEKEIQALLKIKNENPIVGCISYHSMGNLVYYWDYGMTEDVYQVEQNLASLVGNQTGYTLTSSFQGEQDAAGCSDYFALECNIPAVTIENGSGSCPLELDEFDIIWNSNYQMIPSLASFFRE